MMHKLFGYTQHAEKNTARKKNYKNRHYGIATYNQIASDVWETDNPVHKLTTDKPQLVLISVIIRAIFEHLGFTRKCSEAFKVW